MTPVWKPNIPNTSPVFKQISALSIKLLTGKKKLNKAQKAVKRVTKGATSGITPRTTGSSSRSIKEMFKNSPVKVAALADHDAVRAPCGHPHADMGLGNVTTLFGTQDLVSTTND